MSTAGTLYRRVPTWVVDTAVVALAVADAWLNRSTDRWLTTALAALGCAALTMRRRFPLAVFLLTVPATLTQPIAVAPLVALYTLSERSRDRRLLAGCAAVAASASVVPWLNNDTAGDQAQTLILFVYSSATVAAPVLLGQLVQSRRDLSRRLDEIEEARNHERVLHAQAILARERSQLAREMHDVVSHQVSLIAVQAGALQVATADADARQVAKTIRSLSVATLDELRTMVTLLRAADGRATELTPQPTLADLRSLVESSGIRVELSGEFPTSTGTPTQRALYRTVQEALTNVRKHAPGATATVELWSDAAEVGVTVTNTPPSRPSLALPGSQQGLVGLTERAEILHGTLESGPTQDGGYRVRIRIPTRTDRSNRHPP